MKYFIYIMMLTCLLACEEEKVNTPEFSISVERLSYKVNDTVHFNISGRPDFITFYSGEDGNNYDYIRRTEAEGTSFFSFSSKTTSGSIAKQANTLKLLYSVDFTGVNDAENIRKAEWKDITSRAILTAGVVTTPSGNIDISDLRSEKSIHFAFKYTAEESATLVQPTWTITNFIVDNYSPDGVKMPLVTNINGGGWVSVGVLDAVNTPAVKWTVSSGGFILNQGAVNADPVEQWVISKRINLSSVLPDKGVPIKTLNSDLETHSHIYTKAGTYKVVFIAKNSNIYGEKEVIKQIVIDVTEN